MSKQNFNNYNSPIEQYISNVGGASPSTLLFENLIWLTTKEAGLYLRKSVNSIHTLVSRKQLRARKFRNRLYFKKEELDYLIETSQLKGG
jgi:excisionase family DNA binding protein